MPIERKSVVDQMEITRQGSIGVRLAIIIVDDGREISAKYHRTTIPLDYPVIKAMAEINKNLQEMGDPLVGANEIDRVVAFHQLATSQPSPNPTLPERS